MPATYDRWQRQTASGSFEPLQAGSVSGAIGPLSRHYGPLWRIVWPVCAIGLPANKLLELWPVYDTQFASAHLAQSWTILQPRHFDIA